MAAREHERLLEYAARFFAAPQRFLAPVDEIYAGTPTDSFDELTLQDGRVLERYSKIPFIEQRNVGRGWIFRDITARRRNEQALQEQRESFRVTLSSIGDAVVTTDTQAKVTFLNPIAESNDRVALHQSLRRAAEKSIQHCSRAHPGAHREGIVVGLANHTALIGRDGSETAIEDTAPPPELAKDLATVRRNGELEARLIDDLLDLTRITRGKLELHREGVPIGQMIEHAISTRQADLTAKHLTLIRELDRPELMLYADSARITQILWNLLRNSIKFTPMGGLIWVRSRLPAAGAEPGEVTIEVQATGIGMEPAQMPRMFDAFEQGGRNITQQFGGSGSGSGSGSPSAKPSPKRTKVPSRAREMESAEEVSSRSCCRFSRRRTKNPVPRRPSPRWRPWRRAESR